MNISQKERIFFLTQAITILFLFTYSVCDEKVKKNGRNETAGNSEKSSSVLGGIVYQWRMHFILISTIYFIDRPFKNKNK